MGRCMAMRRTVLMFSKLGGETTEKQIKKTSVWGYDRGLSRLILAKTPGKYLYLSSRPLSFCALCTLHSFLPGRSDTPIHPRPSPHAPAHLHTHPLAFLTSSQNSLVILLSGRIPQSQRNRFTIYQNRRRVIIKHYYQLPLPFVPPPPFPFLLLFPLASPWSYRLD